MDGCGRWWDWCGRGSPTITRESDAGEDGKGTSSTVLQRDGGVEEALVQSLPAWFYCRHACNGLGREILMMALCIVCALTWQGGHPSGGASWQTNSKFSDCGGRGHAIHGSDSLVNYWRAYKGTHGTV